MTLEPEVIERHVETKTALLMCEDRQVEMLRENGKARLVTRENPLRCNKVTKHRFVEIATMVDQENGSARRSYALALFRCESCGAKRPWGSFSLLDGIVKEPS